MAMQKSVNVVILGKTYHLSTDENDEEILHAATLVDTLMRNKTEKMPSLHDERAAVVVALQLATELLQRRKTVEAYEYRTKKLVEVLGECAV